jgi:hypothetical protein
LRRSILGKRTTAVLLVQIRPPLPTNRRSIPVGQVAVKSQD